MAFMTRKRRRRMIGVAAIVLCATAAVWLGTSAFRENIMFFFSPAEVAAGVAPAGQMIRVGGIVVPGSIRQSEDGVGVRFDVGDNTSRIAVHYEGILPDLFREDQGIVVQGSVDRDGRFHAREVLAKHDENYMPPEVGEMMLRAEQ